MNGFIPTSWQFGPFARGLPRSERVERLRRLRAVVTTTCGLRGLAATRALRLAEHDADPDALNLAIGTLRRLDAADRRQILASYADTQHEART